MRHVFIERLNSVRAAKDKLPVLSLSKLELFLEHAVFRIQSMLPDMYRLFILKLLRDLQLGTSKMLKETVIV